MKARRKMIDYRTETFMTLCGTRSYTQTANILNITQPAVSQHIRFLENHYGVKLVEYKGKQLYLTPEGEFLRRELSKIISLSKSVENRIAEIEGSDKYKKVVFASNMTMGEYLLPKMVSDYMKLHPDYRICSYIASGKEMRQLISEGKVDYAIVDIYAVPDGMEKELFIQDYLRCVCNPAHPLAGKTASLKELIKENVISREHNAAANNVISQVFARHGFDWNKFKVEIEAGSMLAIEEYLHEIEAISFIYEIAAARATQHGQVSRIEVPELTDPIDYFFVYPDKSCLSEEAANFMNYCKEYADKQMQML